MKLRTGVTLLLTVIIFYLLFSRVDFYSVVNVFAGSNLIFIVLALSTLAPVFWIKSKRWQMLLEAMNHKVSFKDSFYATMMAMPLLAVTPSKMGDLVKAYYHRKTVPVSESVGAVITEKLFDLMVLLLFCLLWVYFVGQVYLIAVLGVGIIMVLGLIIAYKFDFKIDLLNRLLKSLKVLMKDKINFAKVFLITLVFWSVLSLQFIFVFAALGIEVPYLIIVGGIAVSILVGMIPVTLAGMGTRDSAIIFIFLNYADPSHLLGVGLLFSFLRYWLPALIGLPYFRKINVDLDILKKIKDKGKV